MATELGKAYVQIMPSARGISGMISKELKGEATSAGASAGSVLVSTLQRAVVTLGLGKLLKDSLLEGGKLQQSLGGIETLFKDNAGKVKQYANEAYKTTGLSANAYMENVTGFSASLLQSLGGDTAKAAKVANMAMIDMADNSNKMGTSMELIQFAYQGFAKQNYTMLDNLKLGYGGTKQEMQRLLADAQKLTGVKYDINNLNDVYEAIHVIQGELGITGTTAKEAATTLQGSFASMKASFQNVLGKLSLGEDIRPSLNELGKTTSTFLVGNLLPMVGNIFKNIPTLLVEALSGVVGYLKGLLGEETVKTIQDALSKVSTVVEGFINILTGSMSKEEGFDFMKSLGIDEKTATIFSSIADNLKIAFENIWAVVKDVCSIIKEFATLILGLDGTDSSVNLIGSVFRGLAWVLKVVTGLLKTFIHYIKEHNGIMSIAKIAVMLLVSKVAALKVFAVAVKWFQPLLGVLKMIRSVWVSISALFMLSPFGVIIGAIAILVAALTWFFTQTETGKQIWSSFVEFLTNLWTGVKEFFSGLWEGIKTTVETVWNGIKEFFSGLWEGIKTTVETVWNGIKLFFSTLWDGIKLVIETVWNSIKEFFSTTWDTIKTTVETVWNGIKEFFGTLWDGIKTTVETVWNSIKEFFSTTWDTIKTTVETVWNGIKEFFGTLWDGIKTTVETVWNSIKEFFSTTWDSIVETATNIFNGFKEFLSRLWESIKEAVRIGWESIKKTVSDLVNGIVEGAERAWEDLKEGVRKAVEKVERFFDGLKDINLWDAGWEIITGFLNGLKRAYDNVKEFIGGIATWIRDHKGPIEYDRKLLIPAGNAIMQGLDKGLNEKFKVVKNTISGMASEINRGFTDEIADVNLGGMVSRELSVDAMGSADFAFTDKNAEVVDALTIVQGLLEKISNKDNNTYLDGEVLAKNSYDRQMTFVRREGI